MIETSEKLLEMPARAEIRLTDVLHALSDPLRLELVAELAAAEAERACGTFHPPVAMSTLSHHFKVLRDAGLTRTRVNGTQRLIRLRRDDLEARFPGLLDSILASAPRLR